MSDLFCHFGPHCHFLLILQVVQHCIRFSVVGCERAPLAPLGLWLLFLFLTDLFLYDLDSTCNSHKAVASYLIHYTESLFCIFYSAPFILIYTRQRDYTQIIVTQAQHIFITGVKICIIIRGCS